MADSYKQYGIEYQHEGSTWIVHVYATSWKDAEQRLRALQYGTVFGEIHGSIPASLPGGSWWVRLLCWWNNRSTS